MGLLPEHAQVDGSIQLNGKELLDMDENALCRLRGNRMAMVFQEPMTALNPVHGIGRQVAEPLRHHLRLGRQAARAHAVALLERVGRSEEHTSELQSPCNLVCRLLLEKKNSQLLRSR